MELIAQFINFVLHLDKSLGPLIADTGVWIYLILFVVVFCETGLIVTPFLPGDSLLFAVGAFAAAGAIDPLWMLIILSLAAIIGDAVNYSVGRFFGMKILETKAGRLIKREHLERTHQFYEKHGGKTIIIARFMPIIRTFAPFVAGVGTMDSKKFFLFNVSGGLLWVFSMVGGGYFFGNLPFVKKNFSAVILAIIVLSCMPGVIEFLRHRKKK